RPSPSGPASATPSTMAPPSSATTPTTMPADACTTRVATSPPSRSTSPPDFSPIAGGIRLLLAKSREAETERGPPAQLPGMPMGRSHQDSCHLQRADCGQQPRSGGADGEAGGQAGGEPGGFGGTRGSSPP